MIIPKYDAEIALFYHTNEYYNSEKFKPQNVLVNFYTHYNFEEMHAILWGMFKFIIENDDKNKESYVRFYINLYEHMHDLCTASYLIAKEHYLSQEKNNKTISICLFLSKTRT